MQKHFVCILLGEEGWTRTGNTSDDAFLCCSPDRDRAGLQAMRLMSLLLLPVDICVFTVFTQEMTCFFSCWLDFEAGRAITSILKLLKSPFEATPSRVLLICPHRELFVFRRFGRWLGSCIFNLLLFGHSSKTIWEHHARLAFQLIIFALTQLVAIRSLQRFGTQQKACVCLSRKELSVVSPWTLTVQNKTKQIVAVIL